MANRVESSGGVGEVWSHSGCKVRVEAMREVSRVWGGKMVMVWAGWVVV